MQSLTYYVAPISNGLGDLICSLPVIQSLIKNGQETHLVLRSNEQKGLESRIDGLAGTVREADLKRLAENPQNKIINLRDHPLQTKHVWGSETFLNEFPNLYIDDIVRTIAQDFGLKGDFATLKPLLSIPDPRCLGKILFIPASRGLQKCWPISEWLALSRRLKADAMKCLVLGRPDEDPAVRELIEHGVEWLETPQLYDAVDAISAAKAVIGVDTGLTHLAVHQHIPTVALFRYNAVFTRQKRHVRSFLAPKCPFACVQKEFDTDCHKQISFDGKEDEGSAFYWSSWECQEEPHNHCMTKIKSHTVYDALFDLQHAVR
ncbi:MAG: glycosyltransferase family 9 protein [Cyanobacteria bacterium SZAS TMP-1]|nr:glycosyltransferase family 9 protein [Cyanobacteria bacterium SZAS TMP-1]